MTTRRCEDCEAWEDQSLGTDKSIGFCRCYPEVTSTRKDDWCLQFRARKWTAQWENDPLSIKQDVALSEVLDLARKGAYITKGECEAWITKWIR